MIIVNLYINGTFRVRGQINFVSDNLFWNIRWSIPNSPVKALYAGKTCCQIVSTLNMAILDFRQYIASTQHIMTLFRCFLKRYSGTTTIVRASISTQICIINLWKYSLTYRIFNIIFRYLRQEVDHSTENKTNCYYNFDFRNVIITMIIFWAETQCFDQEVRRFLSRHSHELQLTIFHLSQVVQVASSSISGYVSCTLITISFLNKCHYDVFQFTRWLSLALFGLTEILWRNLIN